MPEKVDFYKKLEEVHSQVSANCGKIVLGDLNARLGGCSGGEEHIIGPCTFGRRAVHAVDVPNRDLLVEFFEGASLLVASTFVEAGREEKPTYMEPGTIRRHL